jgi:cell division transport system permease protein
MTAPVVFTTSVATMAAGLLLLAAYLLVLQNMRTALGDYGQDFNVVAYLRQDLRLSEETTDTLRRRLLGVDYVVKVSYISPDEAIERMRRELGGEADVLDEIVGNPLPAAFEIGLAPEARTPERVRYVADQAQSLSEVSEARYGEAWVNSYAQLLESLELLGLVFGFGLLIVLSVIVGGTVRLAVYARADEISIQRLVGAGALYVRLPFYIQGALQGSVGGALAIGMLYGMYRLELPLLGSPLAFLTGTAAPVFFGPWEIAFVVIVGVGLGLFGAMLWLVKLEE